MSRLLTPLLILISLASVLAAILLGPAALSLAQALAALFGRAEPAALTIVWEIRLPRALAAYLAGAALGACGAALQGLLRNPLADPGVLGVSAAAALSATIVIYFGLAGAFAFAVPLAAIAGALAATLFLAFAALRTGGVAALILVGVGLSSLAGALMALLLNFAPNPFSLSDLINWTLGSVANRSLEEIALAAPFLAAGAVLLALAARGLTALSLGEEAAHGIGLNLARARLLVVAAAGLLAGASVSLAGAIGFVGLVAPHLVRPHVGHDPARTLLPSALAAGALLVAADTAARLAPTSSELKLGAVAALLGAPAFIWIALRRGVRADG